MPRILPIVQLCGSGACERFGGVAQRFAPPAPYAEAGGSIIAVADQAMAGARIPKVRFGPTAEPELRGPALRKRGLLDHFAQAR